MSQLCILASKISDAKYAFNLNETALYVKHNFSLAAFQIISLSLIFSSLNVMCLDVELFELTSLELIFLDV